MSSDGVWITQNMSVEENNKQEWKNTRHATKMPLKLEPDGKWSAVW